MLLAESIKDKILPRPFLKWAGGKSKLLEQYKPYIPNEFKFYHEPFLGGGAVFFYLCQLFDFQATLTDINPNLIEAYNCVKNNVEELIQQLEEHQINHKEAESRRNSAHYYYEVRSCIYDTPVERAARLIYLNRTCFNGLYRENSKGEFNVPMGRYKNPQICNKNLLRSVSYALKDATIETRHFTEVLKYAQSSEDFVYFDPPYYPLNNTSYFTAYSKYSFSEDEHIKLRDVFVELAERGVKVMLSNSDCNFVNELYRDCKVFKTDRMPNVYQISASRFINSDPTKRGKINELLITSY
ncbi:MAG TPA: DNA adenine methylase [Candidatus Obscuribacterales bacterium]